MSLKEQQLKKIRAKQKRLQAVLGGTEILDKVNEIEFEDDEGMYGRRLKLLLYFDLLLFVGWR